MRLAATNAINKQQVDTQRALVAQLEAQVRADQAAIDNARAILSYTDIIAPIAGRTGIRQVDEGNIVRPSDTTGLVVITQIKPISVMFNLPQQSLPDLNGAWRKARCRSTPWARTAAPSVDSGKVQVIDNQVDPTTGTVRLKAEFPNANLQLWPGQFVNVRLLIDTLRQVVVVPTAAVQRGPNGTFVFVIGEDSTVDMRRVTIARQDDVRAVVADGLKRRRAARDLGLRAAGRQGAGRGDGDRGGRAAAGAPERRYAAEAQGPRRQGRPGQRRGGDGRRRHRRRKRQEPGSGKAGDGGEIERNAMSTSASVSSPFIHRPIATSLLGVAVMLGGLLGYLWLPVSSLPQVDFPTIQVTTQLPGASPDVVASLVTAPLERQFGQIPSLSNMISSSSFGISQITLQFDLNRDIDAAAQDVQAAINAAGSTLPRNLPYPPIYSKVNPADAPIITLALTSPTISLRQLSDLSDTVLTQRLSEVTGVGKVTVQGGLKPAVRIQADLARLGNYGLGLEDLRTVIVAANVAGPAGSLDGAHQSYTIAANDQITAADAYRNIVVAYRNNAPVLLKDVAEVVDGLENNKVGAWYNGQPAVVVDIQRQPGANVVETVQRIQRELPRLQRAFPAGVELTVVHDATNTIRASIRDVQFTLVLSVALVILVVFIFLRTIRATIIAGRRAAAVAHRHLRRHVVLRVLARQPVADGAHHRHRLRRRRRHRDDREHRAPHGGRRQPVPGGAQGRERDRLHHHLADALADRGVHPALVHDRPRRPHVPRVRADADHRGRGVGDRVADADADDVQPDAAATRRRTPATPSRASSTTASNWTIEVYRRTLEWVLRHEALTLLVLAATMVATVWLYRRHSQGLPAAAGHRPDLRGDGRRRRGLVRRDAAAARHGRGGDPQGSRGGGRRVGRGRHADQRHPERRRASRSRCARATCGARR